MAFRVTAILDADGTRFNRTIRSASDSLNGLARRWGTLFSVGALGIAINKTIQLGSKYTDLNAQLGISVEELQRMEAAAIKAGVQMEDLTKAYAKLEYKRTLALKNPNGREAEALRAFGISAEDMQSLSTGDLFKKVASTQNMQSLLGPLQMLFETRGPQLIEAFSIYTSDALQNMSVMSNDTAQQLDKVADSFGLLKQGLMIDMAPAIVWVINKIRELVVTIKGIAMFWGELSGAGEAQNVLMSMVGMKTPSEKTRAAWAEAYEKSLTWMAEELAKINAPVPPAPPIPPPDPETPDVKQKEALKKTAALYTDSLVGVGNFLGAGRSAVDSVSQKQLVALNSIKDNVELLVRSMNKLAVTHFPSI